MQIAPNIDSQPSFANPRLPRVLIVEDDHATRSAMARLLKHSRFDVTAVGTVSEAMLRLAEPFDAVLIDLMLPDGHGGEIVQWLGINRPTTNVLVLTGCNDPALLKLLNSGASPCRLMRKPVEFADVLAQIKSA